MNKRTLKRAIGVSNGKELILENDCGSVSIVLEVGQRSETDTRRFTQYRVETDARLDRIFDTPEKALAFALRDLAESMDGSPNR